ncbi:MAG: SAM-dependent chlorinase/fluorinase [Candidatus Dormibacteraeota bacterium]|nr:SAM-dependent chlorinase/fluorinase [Candidatus Dormibacteraeota bacterium]
MGTARRAIAVDAGGVVCVAPDNGLISYLWSEAPPEQRGAVELPIPDWASSTFHGRDVFAPAAAQLVSGEALDSLGEPIDDPVIRNDAFAVRDELAITGRVIVVDHFGNAITNVRSNDVGGAAISCVQWEGGSTSAAASTYAEIGDGIATLFGSAGHLEIAARGAPAAVRGAPQRDTQITVLLA